MLIFSYFLFCNTTFVQQMTGLDTLFPLVEQKQINNGLLMVLE